MSRLNTQRLQRELHNVIIRGGTPSKWLIKRCLKDESLARVVFPNLYPPPPEDWWSSEQKSIIAYYNGVIIEQLNKPSVFHKLINIDTPRGY